MVQEVISSPTDQVTVQVTPDQVTVQVDHKVTPAHEQSVTLHIVEAYPSHEPRETDPHYHYFNEARAKLKRLGKLVCWVNNADCGGQIELHHSTVEFALANGVDVTRFHELYPEFGVVTDEEFLAWIEGESNLTPLCLDGSAKVSMADGAQRRIEHIKVGDKVLGKDGLPHRVTDAFSKVYSGDMIKVSYGLWATPEHPVLTQSRGWVPAGELQFDDSLYMLTADGKSWKSAFGMMIPKMISLGRVKAEILDAIVRLVPVNVMHNLRAAKGPAKMLLHDVAVQQHPLGDAINRKPGSEIAGFGQVRLTKALLYRTRAAIERLESAAIGAVKVLPVVGASLAFKRIPADLASQRKNVFGTGLALSFGAANSGACGVLVGKLNRYSILPSADQASLDSPGDSLAFARGRGAVRKPAREDRPSFISTLRREESATLFAAGLNAGHIAAPNREWRAANFANLSDPEGGLVRGGHWERVGDLRRRNVVHTKVFDITVEDSSSFLANGVVVHNCKKHHTGILGVHCLPYPMWLPQRFYKQGIAPPAHCVHGE